MAQNLNIKTFVFLDLETTGLPQEEYNKTKITELCCIGIKSRDINSKSYPRIKQKINLCFYPEKMITLESEKMTGLSNDLLEYEPRFKKQAGNVFGSFLDLLEKPVCIVAHNGDYFDYPILKTEMHKAGSELNDELLCIDSKKAFIHFYEEDTMKELDMINGLDTQKGAHCFEIQSILSVKRSTDAQMINETTPPKKVKMQMFNKNFACQAFTNINDQYYMIDNIPHEKDNLKKSDSFVRKQLHFGKPSFKLVDIYERLTKEKSLVSHRAEDDVLMLIKCSLCFGQRFTNWANNNAVKLSTVPLMKPGKKIGI